MASDDFNRADQSLDGTGVWTELEGQCNIESNKAREADGSTGYHWAVYSDATWAANQSSQAVITLDSDDAIILNATNSGGLNGYHGMINGSLGFRIYRRDAGSFTLLHDGGGTPTTNETFELERVGGTLTLYEGGGSKRTT